MRPCSCGDGYGGMEQKRLHLSRREWGSFCHAEAETFTFSVLLSSNYAIKIEIFEFIILIFCFLCPHCEMTLPEFTLLLS